MPHEAIEVGGVRRTYEHIEPSTPAVEAPLLLALHGTSQRGRTMRSFSGRTLDGLAERIGADLVYLDGHRRAWNDGRTRKVSAAQKRNVDDVGFVRAVVRQFERPTIAIGYSNGGQLLHRVLREEFGLLVGAVVISAGLPVDRDFMLVGVRPDDIPVLLFHGTQDPVVPYGGGATRMLGRTRGDVVSAFETAQSYAPPTEPVHSTATSAEGEIERSDWGRVRLVSQIGTGHVVPNRVTSPAPRFVGPSHPDLDAGEEMADFFRL